MAFECTIALVGAFALRLGCAQIFQTFATLDSAAVERGYIPRARHQMHPFEWDPCNLGQKALELLTRLTFRVANGCGCRDKAHLVRCHAEGKKYPADQQRGLRRL